jgi:C-terminal processing protease CtpA/Prc
MQIMEGGFASRVGMEQGEIIEQIDDVVVQDISHFMSLIKESGKKVQIKSKSLSGKEKKYMIENTAEIEQMGIRVIPEKPLMLYPYNQFTNLGIFEFLKRT